MINKRDLESGMLTMLKNCNVDLYFHYDKILNKWYVDRYDDGIKVPDFLKLPSVNYGIICCFLNSIIDKGDKEYGI